MDAAAYHQDCAAARDQHQGAQSSDGTGQGRGARSLRHHQPLRCGTYQFVLVHADTRRYIDVAVLSRRLLAQWMRVSTVDPCPGMRSSLSCKPSSRRLNTSTPGPGSWRSEERRVGKECRSRGGTWQA